MSDKDAGQRPPIDWVKSPNGVFEMYANMLHVTWTVDDVRLRLAQMVNSPAAQNPGKYAGMADERAAITFSWRMAKVLRNQLTLAIENCEKANGEIKIEMKLPPSY